MINTGDLRNQVELYDKQNVKNELGKTATQDVLVKKLFVQIIPMQLTGQTKQSEAFTSYSEVTHRIKCRMLSIKDLNMNMFFKYNGIKFEILYYQPNFKENDFWEIMVKETL